MVRRFELGEEVRDLKDDLGRLRTAVTDILQGFVESGRGGASDLREKLGANAEKWIHDLRDTFSGAGEKSKKTLQSVQHQIEDRPVASLLIAFGVGMLLGKLLDRRR